MAKYTPVDENLLPKFNPDGTLKQAASPLLAQPVIQPMAQPQAISAETMITEPVAPNLTLPTLDTDTSKADGAVEAVKVVGQNSLQSYIDRVSPPETDTQKNQKNLIANIQQLLPQTTGKANALVQEEKNRGVEALKTQVSNLNAEIMADTAAYEKLFEAQELKPGVPLEIVKGRQAAVRRNQAADLQLKQARLLGLQGNLSTATEMAKRAVDLRYESVEDEVKVKMGQLEMLEPLLTAEEKKTSKALELKLTEEKEQIEERKEKQKANVTMAFEMGVKSAFVNKNGEIFRASDGYPISTPGEFFKLSGTTTFSEAYRKGVVTDVSANQLYEREYINKMFAAYPTAGILPTDDLETARQKVLSDPQFIKDAYIADEHDEPEVDYSGYTEKQMKALDKLNQDVSKNATYAKTTSMRGYIDNVVASLSQGTGVGDIAAINQFQKVIDEGAVTRDQDVKLIQGAQSMANKLRGYVKRLEKGEQLSAQSRSEMRKVVESIYEAQVKALEKDPYISSKINQAQLYGLDVNDTILGEISSFGKQQKGGNGGFSFPLPDGKTGFFDNAENANKAWKEIYGGAGPFKAAGKPQASTGRTPYLKTLGAITGLDGSKYWKYGLDVDLKKGDPVKSPVAGKVIAAGFEKGFGNTVKIQDASGRVWRLSHFDKLSLRPGQVVRPGQLVGLGGNSGTTYSNGGDGSHVDITVYQGGKPIAARQVKSLLDRIMV